MELKKLPAVKVQCGNCYLVHINPWNKHQAWCQATGNGVNPYALRFCSLYREKGD